MRNKSCIIRWFFSENQGQDLAEYCLITAFIAVAACAIYFHIAGGVQNIWTNANSTLVSQNPQTATPPSGSPSTGSPNRGGNMPGSSERGSEKSDNQ